MAEPGDHLGELAFEVTGSVVSAYASVANDHNPIHFDDGAARASGLPQRIAHGMISGAVLSRLLTRELGDRWLTSGVLSLKFVRPVLVGERIVARAVVRTTSPMTLDVRVENSQGDPVILGYARI